MNSLHFVGHTYPHSTLRSVLHYFLVFSSGKHSLYSAENTFSIVSIPLTVQVFSQFFVFVLQRISMRKKKTKHQMRKTRKRKKILWCRYNWCVLSVSGEVNQCGGIYKYPHSIRKWIERTRIAPYLAQQQEATEHSRAPRNTRERERE